MPKANRILQISDFEETKDFDSKKFWDEIDSSPEMKDYIGLLWFVLILGAGLIGTLIGAITLKLLNLI